MATDNFTGSDGDLLKNRSGWAQTFSEVEINTNRINPNNPGGGFCGAVYTGEDLTDNHSSSLLTQVTGFRSIGPTTRAAAATGACYWIRSRYDYNPTDLCEIAADGTISTLDAGDLDSGSQTWLLESDGDQHSVYLNGSLYGSIASPVTDGTITVGDPGVGGAGTNGNLNNYGDDWEGLALGGGGNLATTIAGTSTLSADFTGAGAVAGTTAGTSTDTGAIAGVGAVAGTTAGTATNSATFTAVGAVAGAVAGTSTLSAAILDPLAITWVERTIDRTLLGTSPSRWFREYSCITADPATGIVYSYNGVIDSVHDDSIFDNALFEIDPANDTEIQRTVANWHNNGLGGNNTLQLAADLTTPTMPNRHSFFDFCPDDGYLYFFGGLNTDLRVTRTFANAQVDATNNWLDLADNVTPLCTGDLLSPDVTQYGLTAGTDYYIRRHSSTRISFHTTYANAKADTSRVDLTTGSGTTTLSRQVNEIDGNHPNDFWRMKVTAGGSQYVWEQLFPAGVQPYHNPPGTTAPTAAVKWFPDLGVFVIAALTPAGGSSDSRCTWLYDPVAGTFEQLSQTTGAGTCPFIGSAQSLAYDPIEQCIWAFGGNGTSGGDELWRFDTDKTWTEVTAINTHPDARVNHGVAFAGGKLYVQGGETGGGTNIVDFWAYDPAANSWTELFPVTLPSSSSMSYLTYNGEYLVGVNSGPRYWTYNVLENALEGAVAGTSTLSATVTGSGAVAGTTAGTSALAAGVVGAGVVSGEAPGTSSLSATFTGVGVVAGSIEGAGTLSAAVAGSGALSGEAAGTSSLTGSLEGVGGVSGDIAGTSTLSGAFTGAGAVAGSIAGTSTLIASFDLNSFVGSTSGTATLSATFTGAGVVAGAISGTSEAQGSIAGVGAVAGAISGTSTLAGAVGGVGSVAGAIAGSSTNIGLLLAIGAFSGAIAGTSSLSWNNDDDIPENVNLNTPITTGLALSTPFTLGVSLETPI